MSTYSKLNIVAIIPARGGSKGIPRKNLRLLAGKPLIAHTIEQARLAPSINRVIVSTDDPEIGAVAQQYGAEVVWRPAEISGDDAPSEAALLHVLEHLERTEGYQPDILVFLQCTAPLVVLLLSQLVPKKGFHIVLEAWSKILHKCPEAFLWIVGGGEPDYRRYLEDIVKALKITDTVRFQGSVNPDEVPLCYRAADIYVFPSLCPEGFPLTLFEAMATGLPCVTSLIPSIREFVSEEEVMFIRNPNIVEEFVESITLLLNDVTLRITLGKKARMAVERRFNMDLWLERLRDFYRQQLQLVR